MNYLLILLLEIFGCLPLTFNNTWTLKRKESPVLTSDYSRRFRRFRRLAENGGYSRSASSRLVCTRLNYRPTLSIHQLNLAAAARPSLLYGRCVDESIYYMFDGVRNFSAMRVYANNQFYSDVRVFAAATVFARDVPVAQYNSLDNKSTSSFFFNPERRFWGKQFPSC